MVNRVILYYPELSFDHAIKYADKVLYGVVSSFFNVYIRGRQSVARGPHAARTILSSCSHKLVIPVVINISSHNRI